MPIQHIQSGISQGSLIGSFFKFETVDKRIKPNSKKLVNMKITSNGRGPQNIKIGNCSNKDNGRQPKNIKSEISQQPLIGYF